MDEIGAISYACGAGVFLTLSLILMTGLAIEKENVLYHTNVGQARDFRPHLLSYFADDTFAAVLAECNRTSQRPIELFSTRRVMVLSQEEPVLISENTDHDGSDLSWFHGSALISDSGPDI